MRRWRGRHTTGIILPGYARFDDAARAFVAKTEALCKSPSQAALDDTRAAARAALLAWGRIEPLRFGPMMQKQRFDRLLFYPDQHGIVAKQTAKLLAKRDDGRHRGGEAGRRQRRRAGLRRRRRRALRSWLRYAGEQHAGSVVPLPLRARSRRRHRADRRRDARRMGRRLQAGVAAAERRQQDLLVAEGNDAGAVPRLRHRDRGSQGTADSHLR